MGSRQPQAEAHVRERLVTKRDEFESMVGPLRVLADDKPGVAAAGSKPLRNGRWNTDAVR